MIIAIVLVVFGAGIAALPLVLVVAAIPVLAALGRRYQETRKVRDFRAKSGLGDGTEDTTRDEDLPIHGPIG